MATKTSTALKVTGGTRFKPFTATPQIVEAVRSEEPLPYRKKLPLELSLQRQREIIHRRRGELKRFLSPREIPFKPLRSTLRLVGLAQTEGLSLRDESLARELRLKRQREIIHARRGELKRFLSQR